MTLLDIAYGLLIMAGACACASVASLVLLPPWIIRRRYSPAKDKPKPSIPEPSMPDPSPTSEKIAIANRILATQGLHVHCIPRDPGGLFPPKLRGQDSCMLYIRRDAPVTGESLRVTPSGISATLLFGVDWFKCFIPWASVYCMVGDDSMGKQWFVPMPRPDAAGVDGVVVDLAEWKAKKGR